MQKTERLVAITLLLQARGKMTAGQLASILNVSTRTIYRDIDALSLAHVPVTMDYGPGGGYYLPQHYRFEPTSFTRAEVISLVLGGVMAENHSLFADDSDLHRAMLKLEATLPEEYQADIRAARERILYDTTAWYHQASTAAYLETIRAALWSERQLEILYPADGQGERWLCVEPYGLVYKGVSLPHMRTGVWYMVAFCHECQAFCTFRVRHIQDVKMSEEAAPSRPDFDLRAYWEDARKHLEERVPPFAMTLRILSAARSRIQGDFTVLSEDADGSAIVEVYVESSAAAVAYALALGSDARVINPTPVREAMLMTAQAIANMYQQEA